MELRVMEKCRIDAVIFDLDGVLTDTAEFHFVAWKNLADRLGIYFDREINERLKGVPRLASLEIILERDSVPNRYSEEEKVALATEKNNEYTTLIRGITPCDILPGILALLNDLKERGIKTAVASASRSADFVIGKLEIGHLFDYIADAGSIENQKPAPDIFIDCANRLNVAPSNCVGVEDAAAGVQAIKSAKMTAIGIGDETLLKEADLVLPRTADLTYEQILIAVT